MGLLYRQDALEGLPRKEADRVKAKIVWLWDHRLEVNHRPLRANLSGYYKRRVGSYRIVYTFDEDPDDMVIIRVGLRDEIYRIVP